MLIKTAAGGYMYRPGDPRNPKGDSPILDALSSDHEVAKRKYEASRRNAEQLGEQLRATPYYATGHDALQKQYDEAYAESRRMHDDWQAKQNAYWKQQERQLAESRAVDESLRSRERKAFNEMYEAGMKASGSIDRRIPLIAGGLAVAGLGAYGVHRAMRNK